MSVYVDDFRAPYGRMVMCHMLADSEQELHDMAEQLGLPRKYYQAHASTPHYDICLSKRRLAVQLGAIEIDRRETATLCRRLTAERLKQLREKTPHGNP